MADKQINVTRKYPFLRCNLPNQDLFAVQDGIPAHDALCEASCILSVAVSLLHGIEDDDEANAALYLIQMAKAVVDSIEIGGQNG